MIRRRGFTVLEVLVALGLIALLVGSVFALIGELGRRRAFAAADWRDARGGDALFDRLERDLACVIVGDAHLGAGVRGGSDQLHLLTRGVWITESSDGVIPAIARDLTRAEYVPASGGGLEYQEVGVIRASANALSTRSGVLLAGGLTVRFRYFDGEEWLEEFDSLKLGRLPVAVEVAIWSGPPPASSPAAASSPITPEPARIRVIAIPDARAASESGAASG